MPSFREIPIGRTSEERWQQFQLLKDHLRCPRASVMLDITHGFRSQPLFAAAISAFIRAVDKEPPDLRICYAAEYGLPDKEDSAPIWELTEFVSLLDWAQALRTFLWTGRAKQTAEETIRLGSKLGSPLGELGEAMNAFSLDLETLRTGDLLLDCGGRKSAATRLLHAAERAKHDVEQYAPPLGDVLDRVMAMAEPLSAEREDLSGEDGHKAIAALAKLYLGLGRYFEAMVTVREGWINRYAGQDALCPGSAVFNKNKRDKAEKKALKSGTHLETDQVRKLRNDLSHAQYVTNPHTSDEIVSAVEEIVVRFVKNNLE